MDVSDVPFFFPFFFKKKKEYSGSALMVSYKLLPSYPFHTGCVVLICDFFFWKWVSLVMRNSKVIYVAIRVSAVAAQHQPGTFPTLI